MMSFLMDLALTKIG